MKPKLYLFPTYISSTTPFVKLEDYQQLEKENKILAADLEYYKGYCDRLVELGNLPCLPKDLENLREANTQFAQDNQVLLELAENLNAENRELINKWEESLDNSDDLVDQLFAAQQEIARTKWQRDNLQGALDSLQDSYDKLAEKYTAELTIKWKQKKSLTQFKNYFKLPT